MKQIKMTTLRNGVVTASSEKVNAERSIQQRIQLYNDTAGALTGYDCTTCKNKGYIAVLEDDYEMLRECKCLKIRRCLQNIEKSGLSDALQRMTFENFQCEELWQSQAKATAQNYTKTSENAWFYISGQSGAGKTHLCTAVCGVLLKRGVQIHYTMWRDIFREMQNFQKRDSYFQKLIDYEAIYIDDFLKTSSPKKELDTAFEIINARYVTGKRTIISSEILLQELLHLDNALTGRIRERCNNGTFVVQIRSDAGRNHRMK